MKLEIVKMPTTFVSVPIDFPGRSFTVIPWVEISAKGYPGVPYDAVLRIELKGHGFVCSELKVTQRPGGPPVTLSGIRSIPVESIIRRSRQVLLTETGEAALRVRETPTAGKSLLRWGGPLGLPVPSRRRTSKRRSRDEEKADVELAAVVYRLAEVCGEPPTKAVADQLRIPLGTARFLVKRAVDDELLEPRPKAAK